MRGVPGHMSECVMTGHMSGYVVHRSSIHSNTHTNTHPPTCARDTDVSAPPTLTALPVASTTVSSRFEGEASSAPSNCLKMSTTSK